MTTVPKGVKKLEGVHPLLKEKILKVLSAMDALGFPMLITDGVRTLQEQQALYAKGRTAPGHIVTNADGVKNRSNHQVKDDGWGYACDCTFLDSNGKPSWDSSYPWNCYGACVKAVGLSWGGNFKTITDLPHAELLYTK